MARSNVIGRLTPRQADKLRAACKKAMDELCYSPNWDDLYASDDRRLAPRNADKLMAAHKKSVSDLCFSQSWEDFKERRGVLKGLEIAMQLCQETEKELGGRD